MSYSTAGTRDYHLGSINFVGTPAAQAIRVPKGARFARIVDVHVMASVAFTATTTPGYVDIGTAGTAAKYVHFNCGTTAATDARCFDDSDGRVAGYEVIDTVGEAIEQLEVSFVAPTGGTPAGTGLVTISVEWF